MIFLALWNCEASFFFGLFYYEWTCIASLYSDNDHFQGIIILWPLPYYSELKDLINLELLSLAQNSFSGPIPVEGDLCLLFLLRLYVWEVSPKFLSTIQLFLLFSLSSCFQTILLQYFVKWRICGSSISVKIILLANFHFV